MLFIEASKMAGGGSLTLTGQLGEVMKESARAALSWLRAHAKTYGIDPDFFTKAEMHVHVPAGAIPKDGPSAGVTMATAMASALTGRPVRGDIAMTGEITLSGRVLPIGGVKEKVLAARRLGIHEVIVPKQNAKNINEDLTPELREGLTVHLVSTIDEVLALALQPVASDVRPLKKPSRTVGQVAAPRQLKIVYSARYQIDIGPHVFPTRKYSLVHAALVESGVIHPADCVEPEPASWDDLALVHTAEYLDKMRDGTLSPEDAAQLELPWSAEMVEGFRLMVGGTIQAALIACGLQDAKSDSSDVHGLRVQRSVTSVAACTTRFRITAKASARSTTSPSPRACCRRAGWSGSPSSISTSTTATAPRSRSNRIRACSPSRCTSSTTTRCGSRAGRSTSASPTARTTPPTSPSSTRALPAVMAHAPQCVFYLAGADPYEDDQLGGLRLTKEGLRRRDRMVVDAVGRAGVPLVVTLAGGYARRVEDTVAIHAATIEEAARGDAAASSAAFRPVRHGGPEGPHYTERARSASARRRSSDRRSRRAPASRAPRPR